MSSSFILYFCNLGNEDLLKAEVAKRHPDLSLSFSRPGMISYKCPSIIDVEQLEKKSVIFARRLLLFLEKSSAANLEQTLSLWQKKYSCKVIHHYSFITNQAAMNDEARAGELVLNCIQLADDLYWLGLHRQLPHLNSKPLGIFSLDLPHHAPSRAWLKMAEADAWFGFFRPGDKVLELGSAPGGVTYYLLERQLQVLSLDPGAMDLLCLKNPKLKHLTVPVQYCTAKDLQGFAPEWLVVDMNLPASQSVTESVRLGKMNHSDFLGCFITIKMPRAQLFDQLDRLMKCAAELGLKKMRLVQLEAHKRECLLVGITDKGIKRGCDL